MGSSSTVYPEPSELVCRIGEQGRAYAPSPAMFANVRRRLLGTLASVVMAAHFAELVVGVAWGPFLVRSTGIRYGRIAYCRGAPRRECRSRGQPPLPFAPHR